MPQSLSADEARRIALAAQGFGRRRGAAPSRWPKVQAAADKMALLQIDSVNVLVRSHYLPLFSRIGVYDRGELDRRAFVHGRRRAFFEYWAHEASLVPMALQPLMRWRMARAAEGEGIYGGIARFARDNAAYVDTVRAEIRARGPLSASELDDPGARSGPWWGWHRGKTALEFLFWTGEVTTAFRRGFERIYDLTERVLPAEIVDLPTPSEADAIRALALIGATAHGVATEFDIRDYFRLPGKAFKTALGELVEDGALTPVDVAGWSQPAFLARAAALPATIAPTALLSPFDPLIWHRPRTERLFDFHYRLEFYTPGHKRNFGYFVMPFLRHGRLVARIDLKADRVRSRLLVLGVFAEPRITRPVPMLGDLAAELRLLALWLGLNHIAIEASGDLAAKLRDVMGMLTGAATDDANRGDQET